MPQGLPRRPLLSVLLRMETQRPLAYFDMVLVEGAAMSAQTGFLTFFDAQQAAADAIRQAFGVSLLAPVSAPVVFQAGLGGASLHQVRHACHRADPHDQLVIPPVIAADDERGLFA
jgi:hypothetical protein